MAKLMILGVALATLIASISAAAVEPLGGMTNQPSSKFPEILPRLKTVLASIDAVPSKDILYWLAQVVAGAKNVVGYINNKGEVCEASWVDQAWISKEPQDAKTHCDLFRW